MKKLMIAAAIVCAAAFAQAASLDWSVAKQSLKDSSGTVLSGATAYLVQFASSAAADTAYAGIADGSISIADLDIVGSATSGTGKAAGGISSATATDALLVDQATKQYAVLMYTGTGEGDMFQLSATHEGIAYQPGTSEGTAAKFTASDFSTTKESRTGWTTIAAPEPTSGLLLLLGMAGLALRRRRA